MMLLLCLLGAVIFLVEMSRLIFLNIRVMRNLFLLSIFCPRQQNISYYLTGSTSDVNNTVFTNISSNSPAKGVGIKISNNNGVIPANTPVKLGNVTNNSVSLRLSASYGEMGERVRAGNVKSVIGVTFVYE